MKLWLLFIVAILLQPKACSSQISSSLQSQSWEKHAPLTIDSINKLNAIAGNTYLSNPAYSRQIASKALIAAKISNYKKGIGRSFLNIGLAYWSQSYYPVSLLYIDTASRYFSPNDTLLYAECYCHMGRIYADMKDYRSAAYYLEKARVAAHGNQIVLLDVIMEMSYLYYKTGDYSNALSTINKAMKICRATKDTGAEAILYSRFASMYFVQKQYAKTLGYCDTAIRMSYMVNNKRLRAASFAERSTILLNQNHIPEALKYAKQALAMGDSLGIMDIKARAYKAVIAVYEAVHNDKELIYYQKQFNLFREQQVIQDKQSSSQLMRDYFKLNAQLQDIDQVKQNAKVYEIHVKAQEQTIILLITFLLLLIISLYIIWFYYRQKVTIAQKLKEQHVAVLAQSQIIETQAQNLEELNNFKSKLLAIIGHDLRTPINNLRNLIDLFEDGSVTADEVYLLMKSINPAVKGAELTLSNLLVWADGQIRGNKNLQPSKVNLLAVIEEAEQICRSSTEKKKIQIQHHVNPDDMALFDENHLKVILSNLIGNAIKFSNDNSTIIINIDRYTDKLVLSITDTGIGMTNEEMQKLLSATTHFSKPGTQGETGTGIGLLLCRDLIELNGGKLWLTSAIGKGTTFYFSLPAVVL